MYFTADLLIDRILELPCDEQIGFRSTHAAEDNVFLLNTLIVKSVESNKRLYCGMIDFQKAFNSIYRQGLWYKVIGYGMQGRMLNLVRHMYEQVKCCVKGREGLTNFFLTLQGL